MSKVNLPLFIGSRYSRAKRRNGFISFISLISMIGIGLGVWALITVISIMNGFGTELRGRVLDVASHVSITGQNSWLSEWETLQPTILENDSVVGHAPYINAQGLLTLGSSVTGLEKGKYNIILGEELAFKLGALTGDKVTLVSPQGQSTPAGLMPRLRRFTVIGTFGIGMSEYDGAMAIVHIADAAKIYKAGEQVSGIRIKLDDVNEARKVNLELAQAFEFKYYVDDWTRQHANFFRALEVERGVMFIILSLIIAVAAFNIVSTLVMVVTDKQADIAILRTLGLSPNKVMGIFFVQGVTSGVLGTLIGGVLGVLTALNVDVIVPDVTKIVLAAIGMSMIATLYPAWRASKTHPAQALRYE